MPNETDEQLIRRAQAHDCQSFNLLVERYFHMVFVVAYAHLHEHEAAEELAQETFLRAYLHLSRLNQPACFAAWLNQIARNLALNWKSQGIRKSRLATMVPIDDIPTELPDQAAVCAREAAASREESRILHEALDQLPPEQRELLLLHFDLELSKSEIARRMNLHPSSVGRQLERALQALRSLTGAAFGQAIPRTSGLTPSRSAVARTALLCAAASTLSGNARATLMISARVADPPAALAASQASGALSRLAGSLPSAKPFVAALGLVLLAGGGIFALRSLAHAKSPSASAHSSRVLSLPGTPKPRRPGQLASRALSAPKAPAKPAQPVVPARDNASTGPLMQVCGRVLYWDGTPAAHATVKLWHRLWPKKQDAFRVAATATADAQGYYRLTGPDALRLAFTAEHPKSALYVGEIRPDNYTASSCSPALGRRYLQRDIVLPRPETITGRVLDPAGNPVQGATITDVSSTNDFTSRSAVSAQDGSFRLERLAGSMSLKAQTGDLSVTEYFQLPCEDVTLRLSPQSLPEGDTRICGQVLLFGSKRPVPNAEVRLVRAEEWNNKTTSSTRGKPRDVTSDSSGKFAFEGLRADEYCLFATHPDFRNPTAMLTYVSTLNTSNALQQNTYVHPGITVSGTVRDATSSAPLAGVSVMNGIGVVESDKDGKYRLAGNPCGSQVRIAAKKSGYVFPGERLRERLQFRRPSSEGWPIKLDDLPTTTLEVSLDLEMRPAPTVSGSVVGPDGAPVVGARILVNYLEAGNGPQIFASDTQGHYEIPIFSGEPVSLIAQAPGFGDGSRPRLECTSHSLENVEIRLTKPARIQGVVVDAQGKPVPCARVVVQFDRSNAILQTGWALSAWPDRQEGLSDAQGCFALPEVSAGPLLLSLFPPGDSKNASDQPLTLEPGQECTGLRLVVPASEH